MYFLENFPEDGKKRIRFSSVCVILINYSGSQQFYFGIYTGVLH